VFQVLAATQRPGSEGKRWFQGTADAVRQFDWLFDVRVPFDAFFLGNSTPHSSVGTLTSLSVGTLDSRGLSFSSPSLTGLEQLQQKFQKQHLYFSFECSPYFWVSKIFASTPTAPLK
jgi:hypothetical protein